MYFRGKKLSEVIGSMKTESLTSWVDSVPENVVDRMADLAPMLAYLGKFRV